MFNWVKKNKLATILLLIVLYFLYKYFFGINPLRTMTTDQSVGGGSISGINMLPPSTSSFGSTSKISLPNIYPQPDYAPQPEIQDRLVIQESSVSLLVKDVVDSRNKILGFTQSNGGYMVNSSTSNPQDAPTATVVIRIPAEKLQSALDYFHTLSIKVVSEDLMGFDVTDQYVDIESRLKTLEATKTRFEAILANAIEVQDITNLTREILNVQSQIDSYKGQQESLKKNAQMAKLTIYLSTDEIALPYAPSETFRPNVIFKLAVRSLVKSLRNVASLLIWVGVYAAIWVPVLLIILAVKKYWDAKKEKAKKLPSS